MNSDIFRQYFRRNDCLIDSDVTLAFDGWVTTFDTSAMPIFAIANVTAHPLRASVLIIILVYIKGSTVGMYGVYAY